MKNEYNGVVGDTVSDIRLWYNKSYCEGGVGAQRRWPNEEFCRFMGRNYFNRSIEQRQKTKILEVGCGSGANLRLLAAEQFDTYGIDLSDESLKLVKYLVQGDVDLRCGDMSRLLEEGDYEEEFFDAIVDVFSSYCLNEVNYKVFVESVFAVLKRGGKYFSYTPAKTSDAFKNYEPAQKIDNSTLNGICREDSPFYGNFYSFRFMDEDDVYSFWDNNRFNVNYFEKLSRTYNNMNEYFDFIVFEVEKKL